MLLMRDASNEIDTPLVCDACGFGMGDFSGDGYATTYSNHPDGMVNIVHHDLSLARMSADSMLGVSR